MAESSAELRALLVETPFFGGLSGEGLEGLIAMLVARRFEAGAVVVAEGEPGRSMYLVRAGTLAVQKRGPAGRPVAIARLGPGDFFGEMTLIEMQNRSATLTARPVPRRAGSAANADTGRHPGGGRRLRAASGRRAATPACRFAADGRRGRTVQEAA